MPRVAARDREALVESRRQSVLEAALRLWARRGFEATTVEEIARSAGVAKGTVYLYFPTKRAILDALIERYSLLPDLALLLGRVSERPPEELVPGLVGTLWTLIKQRVAVLRIVLRELPLAEENAHLLMQRVILPANRLFADYLDAWAERGAVSVPSTFVAARALVGMLGAFAITQELLGGSHLHPLSDAEITDTVSRVFLHGVLARPAEGAT